MYRLMYSVTGAGRGVRVILLYHSIGDSTPQSVPPSLFQRQMEILVKQFQIVCLRDLPSVIISAPADRNIACLTFDDGYRDNYELAFPVLERLGIKATFFITTGFLAKSFPTFAGEVPMMNGGHVRELASAGHEVGAHTVSHKKLTQLAPEDARKELEDSKRFLEDLLSHRVVSFAYPKGDHNEAVKNLVRSVGLKLAVTIQEGLVGSSPDWLALPRAWINSRLGVVPFRAKLSPTLDQFQSIRKWLLISS